MIIDTRMKCSSKNFERRLTRERFSIFLLWLLSKKERHGYEMIRTIGCDRGMAPAAASKIYPLLNSLLRKGLISQRKDMHGKRARKVYRLTAKGREALRRAKQYMRSSPLMVQYAKEMLG